MKGSHLTVAIVALVVALAVPSSAWAFQVTGGGGTQTQNPYGLWYAGQEACAQEGCHSQMAGKPTVHSEMETDVRTYPSLLTPSASSNLWPFSNPFGGPILRPRDIYLQIGGRSAASHEYVGFAGTSFTTTMTPADDVPIFGGMKFGVGAGAWNAPSSAVSVKPYEQSCGGCHGLGVTRPSNATYTLANGATQSTATPSSVSAFSVQCEACHGSGKNPSGHKTGVPGVVAGVAVLRSQVCGQCHATGTTPQKNAAGSAFSNPNGYTPDATLSAYFTPNTTVETETTFMNYVNSGGTKPKFLPNGDNYSMRYGQYNEWLPSGHGTSPRASVLSGTNTTCLRCHSGLGFLYRIGAKAPNGKSIVATEPTPASVKNGVDPGISCQVCHGGHVTYKADGTPDSRRKWADGHSVTCGDCHNWRYELVNSTMQHETIGGVEYTRPPLNARPHTSSRELYEGGFGGEDGRAGMWGVPAMGEFMPGVKCEDCHMPHSSAQGSTAPLAGNLSHRFHVIDPGDAARWKLKDDSTSCAVTGCHHGEAAGYSLNDYQDWMNETSASVNAAAVDASSSLGVLCGDFGFTRYRSFESAQPTSGVVASVTPAVWTMLQHAAQNADVVIGDKTSGLHNPPYAIAGLRKAAFWARAAEASITATLGAGPADGAGMTVHGTLTGTHGSAIDDAVVVLESSTDGGSTWSTVATAAPKPDCTFSVPTGRIVGSRLLRCSFLPAEGVEYRSALMAVDVPVTVASVLPGAAAGGWADAPSVVVTLSATPGSLTFYSVDGATTLSSTVYTGPIAITAEGESDVRFWSSNSQGVEAPTTLMVGIDRGAPHVACDAVSTYIDKAEIRASALDAGSGIEGFGWKLDGEPGTYGTQPWAVIDVVKPGRHVLVLTADDAAGKTTARSWEFTVRANMRVANASSRSTIAVRRGGKWKFAAIVTTRLGAAVAGKTIYLQRSSNGSKWTNAVKLQTAIDGAVSRTISAGTSTSYWRWYVPGDGSYLAAAGARIKLKVK